MSWQQYFPTYHFDEKKNRDIALEEYKFCCKVVESEERIFDNLTKYILAFGTIIISLLSGANKQIEKVFSGITENPKYIWIGIAILVILFFIFMTINFAERQKSIVFAKRKIIVLRRMLGIDYGTQEFLFKKGMLEGANMPFSIKLKVHYLYFMILALCFVALFIIGNFLECDLTNIVLFDFIIFIILYLVYICCILDNNERMFLVIFRIFFSILGVRFVDNFEHILYRAKLSVDECERQKINLNNLKKILVAIEDRNFYQHKGVDWKATGRALLSRGRKIPFIQRIMPCIQTIPFSGGSTITQQLFRTLFIENIDKRIWRRKLAEICLSRFWLNNILSKEEQLEIYLNAVRFDRQVFGIMQAMKHFYKKYVKDLSIAQSFFLIERVSVTSGTMLPKIIDIIVRLENEKILNKNDIKEIITIYTEVFQAGKIKVEFKNENILEKLCKRYEDILNFTTDNG
ncbi:biosynthetic peptidoglycan transglycosylase [Helicobacter sp. MIT 05-5293]|uniref:biosynthetic peptidoglycan transglycosylase n=1 Tax=Helicobacter sp. MIT 05-5293 TaxID=1548149 RepID=UPI000AF9188A|nr:biosynthetic peptidoglycan transglycosylase [Helicobacter sp. MIT 05-5293]